MTQFRVDRRRFLKTGVAGAGLAVAFSLAACDSNKRRNSSHTQSFQPDIWYTIAADGTVTIQVNRSELGQGAHTGLAMIVADELEADWSKVRVEHAPLDEAYGSQTTGGSTSIRENWEILRQAGAIGRAMLTEAAAAQWEVPASECQASAGRIIHRPTGQSLTYGELSQAAAALNLPTTAPLKSSGDFRLIGQPAHRLDVPQHVDGSTRFAADVEIPGALTATVVHCPVFGGRVKSFSAEEALRFPGVHYVVAIEGGVAVVAEDFWSASQGVKRLRIDWDYGAGQRLSDDAIRESLRQRLAEPGRNVQSNGDVASALKRASDVIQAEYEFPYQAHAPMEPMDCAVRIRDGTCEIWAPTQSPWHAYSTARERWLSPLEKLYEKVVRRLTGRAIRSIQVHTTPIGGGFGRRLEQDYIAEAVDIALAVDAPIKLVWSREEDIRHDVYRTTSLHRIRAGIDQHGRPVAWQHEIVGPDVSAGGATRLPYAVPNLEVTLKPVSVAIPTGSWRSVSHSYNAFVKECFVDELAKLAGQDPLEYRLALMNDAPRLRGTLELAAEQAGWADPAADGLSRGIAAHSSFGSHIAQVAEVILDHHRNLSVRRVVCAVDCGTAINPDSVAAQMEGAVAFGLTATLRSSIAIRDGQVFQSNFHDFPLLRLDEMPVVETHLVASNEPPGGIGEPGVPPLAPAVANAVHASTGIPVRRLPIDSRAGLKS